MWRIEGLFWVVFINGPEICRLYVLLWWHRAIGLYLRVKTCWYVFWTWFYLWRRRAS